MRVRNRNLLPLHHSLLPSFLQFINPLLYKLSLTFALHPPKYNGQKIMCLKQQTERKIYINFSCFISRFSHFYLLEYRRDFFSSGFSTLHKIKPTNIYLFFFTSPCTFFYVFLRIFMYFFVPFMFYVHARGRQRKINKIIKKT